MASMPFYVKVLCMIVLIVAALAILFGIVTIFTGGFPWLTIIVEGVATMLIAGAVWLLADIAETLRKLSSRTDQG